MNPLAPYRLSPIAAAVIAMAHALRILRERGLIVFRAEG